MKKQKINEYTFYYLDETGCKKYKFFKGFDKDVEYHNFLKWCKSSKFIAIC